MKAMPTTAIKEHNRNAMTVFLYQNEAVTKQDFARELGLSLPTITQNLRALEEDGIAVKGGLGQSTGGRKAQTYEFNPRHCVAIGVAMRSDGVRMRAVDLRGDVIDSTDLPLPYRDDDAYYRRMGTIINGFAERQESNGSQVLGVAFAVQGIVSADGTTITFGKIMGNTGLTIDRMAQTIAYPAMMIHDSDASAMAELWADPTLTDAVCIYLERRPGGAVIIDGKLHQGPNQCNGTIEHMTLVPGGRECYCGQRGCMDVYCSPESLPEDYESIPGFFSVLRQGERGHRERMDAWLDYVAQAIVNARSVIAGDVIVGGEASEYLTDEDIEDLRRRVVERTPFGTEGLVLRRTMGKGRCNIVGAALRYVEDYIEGLFGTAA